MSPDERLEQVRAWLLLRRQELTRGVSAQLRGLEVEDGLHLADLEELASNVSADGIVFEQFRSSSESLELIEAALARIEDGTYYTCEECGGEIGLERLSALPYATQCVSCRRAAEASSPGI